MMNIKELLTKQAELQVLMGLSLELRSGEKAVKESILACAAELFEVLNEINWKPWKKTKKPVDEEKLKSELVDVLQFWANAVNAAGFSPEEMEEALKIKWQINERRVEDGY